MSESEKFETADDAARFLRYSISITDTKKQRAIDVLCAQIECLRVASEINQGRSTMTTIDLEQVNRERRRKGLPPLNRDQAYSAMRERASSARSDDSGFDATHFLIGYATGIPMPSAGGLLGAMLHDSGSPSTPSCSPSNNSDSFSGGGGSYGGGGASGSWDSSSSSSSSDSSSSSSSDSGSSSSGGSD